MRQSLDTLKPTQKAVVFSHHAQGSTRQRLLDLGLIPEVEIEVVRYAPMGDPMEIKVGLTHVVIRIAEAETVMVETQDTNAGEPNEA